MSTVQRRRGKSLHLDLPRGGLDSLPPVAAVFLVLFDVKAGYTIAWKRSLPELDLNGSVEYKSMPSGLHNVHEDLIYFVHDDKYAGISAFVNKPAAESERNALMLAVGALVPLSYGRLGKSWKHAGELKDMARHLAQDPENTQILEDFWTANQYQEDDKSPASGPRNGSPLVDKVNRKASDGQPKSRNRAGSTGSALVPQGQSLSPYHPALSLPSFLDTFGPLIFPLYKAALLRKRILMVGQAPVALSCDFVYNISVLSNIPGSVSDLLPLEPLPARLRALFSVGVHDIPTLTQGSRNHAKSPAHPTMEDDMGYGWVAFTTDDILATKESLYDTLVTIPPSYTKNAKNKVWPRVESKRGTEVKATQRDLRRYRTLRRELRRHQIRSRGQKSPYSPFGANSNSEDDPNSIFPIENTQETFDDASSTSDEKLIEPQSWSALAYSSFMWWASAGEKRADLEEEADYDSALLRDFEHYGDGSPNRPRSSRSRGPESGTTAALEMAVIAYFHRLTALILGTLAEIIDASNDDDDGRDGEREEQEEQRLNGVVDECRRDKEAVFITSEDMARMGLDIWSEGDRRLVKELVDLYWGRQAEVQGAMVECCGIRIC